MKSTTPATGGSGLKSDPPPAPAAPPHDDSEHTYLTHQQILVVLGGLMAGMFLAALDQSIVGTALPRIVSDLGGLDHLSWVVTAYLLTSTAATPLWGKISDLYGRRLIFQLAIAIFLIGSAALRAQLRTCRSSSPSAPSRASAAAVSSRLPSASSATSFRRANAAATRAISARSSACPASPARSSAAGSPMVRAGAGSFISTAVGAGRVGRHLNAR